MPWTKIDDNFYSHPKVLQAGAEGVAIFICGLSYCARYLTDGFIADVAISQLYPVSDHQAVARRLVGVGLWDKVPGGYQIHDYLEYNPSAEKIKADRKARARRQAEWRKRNPPSHRQASNDASNGVSNGVSRPSTDHRPRPSPSPVSIPPPIPSPLEEPRTPGEIFFAAAFNAYQETIGLVSGAHQRDAIMDILEELEAHNAESWWQMALDIAADQNKRSLAYVRGILRRCLAEGRPPLIRAIMPGKPEKRTLTVVDPETGAKMQVEATV